jgi:3-demethoxyubiquinol 3-hydroxylase
MTSQSLKCTKIFYDGSCPICSKEVGMYRQQKARQILEWVDVSHPQFVPPLGQSAAELMQRFHVQTSAGELLSGAQAFVYLWAQLPGWRALALMARLPGMLPTMEWAYRQFLKRRPKIQKALQAKTAKVQPKPKTKPSTRLS